MGVALICTVKNERHSMDILLDSLARQTRPPDEVIVVDGGSDDGTAERIAARAGEGRLRLVRAPGANIARGRNLAIAATGHEIIAVTDAGVRLTPDWLERLTAPFGGPERPDVVAGFFVAEARTPFERAMAATVLPIESDVRAATFLPSSRSVAFRRAWWERVGGYPEWLDYGEDVVFDLALRRAGAHFAFEPRAAVRYRPRATLGAFFRQYFRYARGDGKANLWPERHAIRYGAYALGGLVLWLGLRRRRFAGPCLALLGALGALYLRRPYQRLRRGPTRRGDVAPRGQATRPLPQPLPDPGRGDGGGQAVVGDAPPSRVGKGAGGLGQRVLALALVPLIRLTGDVAKMLGYPAGVWWRLRRGHSGQAPSRAAGGGAVPTGPGPAAGAGKRER